MKIELVNDKIILYLYDYFFESEDKKKIIVDIKNIFSRLIEYYQINIKGIYDVLAFENKKYGTILEIISKDQLLFHPDLIDIKLKFYKDAKFYLKTKDYYVLSKYNNIYYDKDYFYIDINNIDKILNILEFVKIIYNEKDINLNKMILIK